MSSEQCVWEERDSLEKLRRLTEILPPAPNVEMGPAQQGITPVISLHGENPIIGLFKDEDMALIRGWASPGTVIDRHDHGNRHEWIGIAIGEMEIEFDDGTVSRIKAPDCVYIPPNHGHIVKYPTYVKIWAVTMPADPAFPDAGK